VPAVNGQKILSVALDGEMGEGPVQASANGDGFRLTGSRTQVGYGPVADAFLVPAETDSGIKVFVVAASDSGVTVESLSTTGHGSVGHLELRGVELSADRVVGGDEVLAWLTTRGTLGRSALQLGVVERALELTAEYAREREQFERPIGSFQAVHSRAADAFIDVEAMRLTTWLAAWRLSEELPATDEVAVAKYWAAEGGQFVGYAAQHLHGGIGIDVDYPLHRYYLWAKQLELTLGSAPVQLARIGARMARDPAPSGS
jgi:alkylation response protein AidB-like acyl-CoA dehydrogenase